MKETPPCGELGDVLIILSFLQRGGFFAKYVTGFQCLLQSVTQKIPPQLSHWGCWRTEQEGSNAQGCWGANQARHHVSIRDIPVALLNMIALCPRLEKQKHSPHMAQQWPFWAIFG